MASVNWASSGFTLGINAENKASLRVVEKLGFRVVRSGEGAGSRWHDLELVIPDRPSAA